MKKRALIPNERSRVSLLNALAESIHSDGCDKASSWEKALKIAGEPLYSNYVLNALLKIAARINSLEHLKNLLASPSFSESADEISFTIAMNSIARHGLVYECFSLHNQMLESDLAPTFHNYAALLLSIKCSLKKSNTSWSDEFCKVWSDRVTDVLELSKLYPHVSVTSLALECYMKLGHWDDAASQINLLLKDKIKACTKLKEIESELDHFVISMMLMIMSRSSKPVETHSLYELCFSKGFKPSTDDVNSLLFACKALALPKRAIAFFDSHFNAKRARLQPSKETLIILRQCLGSTDPFYTSVMERFGPSK
jgi:pentatricopeptide repeat protein